MALERLNDRQLASIVLLAAAVGTVASICMLSIAAIGALVTRR